MANQSLSRHPAHHPRTAHLAQIKTNLEIIHSAICSQSLLLRFDSSAAERLLDIAGDLEHVTDRIGGAS